MTEKDTIMAQLLDEVRMPRAEVAALKKEVARLKKNSSNSSNHLCRYAIHNLC
jgi:hypothetical protein